MKQNLPVTEHEYVLTEADNIISTTDLKGRITYCNEDFIRISGFSNDELIGKSHNIVRHPDMPPAAFADLWNTLATGEPWMGIVKNRCKNGDYYWVDAYVTPIYENNTITGYQSVRTKPSAQTVKNAEQLYKKLLKPSRGIKIKLPELNISQKITASMTVILTGLFGFLYATTNIGITSASFSGLLAIISSYVFARLATSTLRHEASEAKKVINNPVMQIVYTGTTNDITSGQLAIKMLQARLRTVLGRISDSANNLSIITEQTAATIEQTNTNIISLQTDTEMVATAIHEMTANVSEVARNTEQSAQSTKDTKANTTTGKQVIENIINSTNELSNNISNAATVTHELQEKSNDIGMILEVIKTIAEQTNLLALNAAIEAARAGEQGRGFAVVADEVRTLAQRTQESTREIETVIDQLQKKSLKATTVMEESCAMAQANSDLAHQGGESLDNIVKQVDTIVEMNTQIACAVEEQSAVSEEINKNITSINEMARENATGAQQITAANKTLITMINDFRNMTKQFGN